VAAGLSRSVFSSSAGVRKMISFHILFPFCFLSNFGAISAAKFEEQSRSILKGIYLNEEAKPVNLPSGPAEKLLLR
jgi:hypothetical protein